jgi:hypothetical protein
MSSTRSEKEIQEGYCSAMGEELGSAFFQLYRKLIELHIVWQQYRQLFGSDPETVHLINRTAGLFFKIVQDELWDSVLLGVSRMTDPPKTGAKKNLTIQSLPALIADSSLREDIATLCRTALEDAAFAREHRNKRIAHQDRDYLIDRASNPLSGVSRERVETMLNSLRAVLNRLDAHYRDTTVMYQDFVDESGARLLVSKLKKLERIATPGNTL